MKQMKMQMEKLVIYTAYLYLPRIKSTARIKISARCSSGVESQALKAF